MVESSVRPSWLLDGGPPKRKKKHAPPISTETSIVPSRMVFPDVGIPNSKGKKKRKIGGTASAGGKKKKSISTTCAPGTTATFAACAPGSNGPSATSVRSVTGSNHPDPVPLSMLFPSGEQVFLGEEEISCRGGKEAQPEEKEQPQNKRKLDKKGQP